ncbi:MAG TPA: TetR/AcrR family transcriptional regulator [Gemmatimonadaceae bacterium]|nr:TetR/AcrR family transcriptional regulator [Gemmatimonadaceae bacterium]
MIARAPDARTAILDAAEQLFAESGFSATTIKQIGEKSGQNTALIYYYFDNKATLYRHVLDRIIGEIAGEGGARAAAATSPEDVIRAVVAAQVSVLSRRSYLPLLLTRELIDWKAAHAEGAIRHLASTLFERLRVAIEDGQRSGSFRSDLNPRYAAISVVAQVAYLILARPIAGVLLGRGAEGPTAGDLALFGQHAAAFAIAALRSPAEPHQGPDRIAQPAAGEAVTLQREPGGAS